MSSGMVVDHCPMAEQLMERVRAAHAALITHAAANGAMAQALYALEAVIAAGLSGVSEEELLATPSPGEWSMAEVLEHIAEHDGRYAELTRHGFDHYVEHNLEHALQLWQLRPQRVANGE